jgi:hypothetical protein
MIEAIAMFSGGLMWNEDCRCAKEIDGETLQYKDVFAGLKLRHRGQLSRKAPCRWTHLQPFIKLKSLLGRHEYLKMRTWDLLRSSCPPQWLFFSFFLFRCMLESRVSLARIHR